MSKLRAKYEAIRVTSSRCNPQNLPLAAFSEYTQHKKQEHQLPQAYLLSAS